MTLLFPLGLAALVSLILPLILHLARRTEQRPTDFAALRWLRQKPRPRHRPRFDERLLLATRLLLLAAIPLVLALPVLTASAAPEAVIAVVPGAAVPPPTATRRIWLAPGFPSIDTAPPASALPIASLVRQLDAELPPGAALTIVVPRILDGADAERPKVSRLVTWQIAGAGKAASRATPPPLPILRSDPTGPGARYIAAALRALAADETPVSARQRGVETTRSLIWLTPGALPPAIAKEAETGAVVLVAGSTTIPAASAVAIWRDAVGMPLVEAQPLGRGRLLRFTRPLTPQAMPELLEPDFPHRLAALFATAESGPTRTLAAAYTPQPGAAAPRPPSRPLWPWLAVAVAMLFLAERLLATRTARAPAP